MGLEGMPGDAVGVLVLIQPVVLIIKVYCRDMLSCCCLKSATF